MGLVAACMLFGAGAAACAHRLRFSPRAWEAFVPLPLLLAGWVVLLTLHAPSLALGSLAYLGFHLVDMVLVVLALTRLLGGAPEDGAADPGDDGSGDDDGDGGRGPTSPTIGPDPTPGLRRHPPARGRRPQVRPSHPRRGTRRPVRVPAGREVPSLR